jgi:Ca-activated chloride channel family protein
MFNFYGVLVMRKYVYVLIPLYLLAFQFPLLSASIRLLDPQGGYNNTAPNVQTMDIKVMPQGIYTSYEIQFTVLDDKITQQRQLELEWIFTIPQNAFFNNAWLWVGDTLVEAAVLDRWTASMIYEGIVNRRRDPLIMFKNGNSFEMRLYPFIKNTPRKFILKYMIPNVFSGNNIKADFPMDQILPSAIYNKIKEINLSVYTDFNCEEPVLTVNTNLTPEVKKDIDGNEYNAFKPDPPLNNLGIVYQKKDNKEILMGYKQTGIKEGYYQLLFNSDILINKDTNNILFLVNFDKYTTTLKKAEVLTQIKNFLLNNFHKINRFNILFSNYNIVKASDSWLQNDAGTIDSVFKGNADLLLSDYSNLPNLIREGIDFVNNQSLPSKIILISNSQEFTVTNTANAVIADILKQAENNVPINIFDYQNINFEYTKAGGTTYYGNEYFYINIAKQTKGNYVRIYANSLNTSFIDNLNTIYINSINNIMAASLVVEPANGLTYLNYTNNIDLVKSGTNIYQYGKYYGELPFLVKFAALRNNIISNYQFTFDGTNLKEINETDQVWYAKYLKDLENTVKSNEYSKIKEIIDVSIATKILTNYTAYLALEPWMTKSDTVDNNNKVDEDGDKNTDVGEISEIQKGNELQISVSPNPVVINCEITITKPADEEIKSIRIYDLKGNLVRILYFNGSNTSAIFWDSKDEFNNLVNKGIYTIVVETNKKSYIAKIVKV